MDVLGYLVHGPAGTHLGLESCRRRRWPSAGHVGRDVLQTQDTARARAVSRRRHRGKCCGHFHLEPGGREAGWTARRSA